MNLAEIDGVLFCEDCASAGPSMVASGMVGPGTVFPKFCPHIELTFIAWREEQRANEPARWRDLWYPLVIGIILGWCLSRAISHFING